MSTRATPNRWVLIFAIGILSASCGDEDSFNLDCSPATPQVGEDVTLTLEYDVESASMPFTWSDTIGLGTFAEDSSGIADTSGTVSNVFSTSRAGSTVIEVRQGQSVVTSCDIQVRSAGTFEVSVQVVGSGTVSFAGFECREPCQREVDQGELVEFVASPDEGWRFDAWTGDCADFTSNTATVTIDGPTSCGARFIETPAAGVNQVVIPAGTFTRGCTLEIGCAARELPARAIAVSEFAIDRFEVTVADYRACVTAGDCATPPTGLDCNYYETDREQHPMNCVTWDEARTFCEAQQKRLPTEAEWELAARGTDDMRIYPWGDEPATCDRANHFSITDSQSCGIMSMPTTTRVGSLPNGASPNMVLDMSGNVFEWVSDWYDADYFEISPDTDPRGPAQGDGGQRVVRGGSFVSTSFFVYAYSRLGVDPGLADRENGFRCAR